MPTVPRSAVEKEEQPGLLAGPDTQPDASSILMAAALMRSQGRIGQGTAPIAKMTRKAKTKALGRR